MMRSRKVSRVPVAEALAVCLLVCLASRAWPAPPPERLMEVVLEKKTGDTVASFDSGHVFDSGDIVRLRLRPDFDGYFYVIDLGTSGKNQLLFPRQETGTDNRVERGREYVVPATADGWFQISGPAGYETLYFILSPVALTGALSQALTGNQQPGNPNAGIPQGTAPGTMTSRCNDAIFKARGECVDKTAGPKRVEPGVPLPDPVQQLIGNTPIGDGSRDLNFTHKSSSSVVTSSVPLTGPVVYEFLLAHK